jgi:mercuric ion binding protein
MKLAKIYLVFSFLVLGLFLMPARSFAQVQNETIPVAGNCGMCRAKIEKAAKTAGAEEAKWSSESQSITIKYNSSTTNAAKIQKAIAAVGYDTRDHKASDKVYDKLPGCCKYDRMTASDQTARKDCCEGSECKHGQEGTKDCCKDGKCTKGAHDAKDCCKASH